MIIKLKNGTIKLSKNELKIINMNAKVVERIMEDMFKGDDNEKKN